MGDLGTYVYYALVYNYLQNQIAQFQTNVVHNMMAWVSGIALVMVSLWIMIKGYFTITGQSTESMMALVLRAGRVALIVTAASTMSVMGSDLESTLSATGTLGTDISQLVSGQTSPVSEIDRNMAATQLTLAAIDVVQVAPGDTQSVEQKAHAEMLAGFGAAGPAMAAGAMLLLYQFTMAMFIGFGPLFILCLIFEQTKSLFHKWLMYGIGTLFSIAMLCVVTGMVLKLTENVAGALWASSVVNKITGLGAEGFSSQALQQGGIGLLLTVLVISVPPAAAQFFGGTLGNFMAYSQFGGSGNRLGPQGQPPGQYGGGYGGSGSYLPPANTTQPNAGFSNTPVHQNLGRMTGNATTRPPDIIKPAPPSNS